LTVHDIAARRSIGSNNDDCCVSVAVDHNASFAINIALKNVTRKLKYAMQQTVVSKQYDVTSSRSLLTKRQHSLVQSILPKSTN
jgi:hypothetical protein